MNKIIAELEKKQCKENVTEFNIGDTVKVFTKICIPPLRRRTRCRVDSFWML